MCSVGPAGGERKTDLALDTASGFGGLLGVESANQVYYMVRLLALPHVTQASHS
jgi:hypothetical protein